MVTGVNIDPANSRWGGPLITDFGMDKMQGVRLVSRPSVQTSIDYYKSQPMQVLAVVTPQSNGYVSWNADIVQVGNEPDVAATYMSPLDYANLWNLYRNTYPNYTMFSAGLASGGTNARDYLASAWPRMTVKPDAVAIHPYAKTADQAAADFDLMWNEFGVPVVATEWYRPADQVWDFLAMLRINSSVWHSWFCYTDLMSLGAEGDRLGLVDEFGNPKPEGASFVSSPSL